MDGNSVGVCRALETVSAASPTAEARDLVQGAWGTAQACEDEIGWGLAPGSPSRPRELPAGEQAAVQGRVLEIPAAGRVRFWAAIQASSPLRFCEQSLPE